MADSNTDRLKSDVDRLQADIGSTADAIKEKMKPKNLFDEVVSSFRMDGPGGVVDRFVGAFRDHPVPMMMAGLAVATVFGKSAGSRSERGGGYREGDYNYGGTYEGGAPQEGGGKVDELKDSATGKIEDITGRIREKGEQAARPARTQLGRGRDYAFDHPLVLAGLGLAIGATIGAAIPTTEKEKELGHKADEKLIHEGREKLQQAKETASGKAQQVAQGVKEAVKENVKGAVTGASSSGTPSRDQNPELKTGSL